MKKKVIIFPPQLSAFLKEKRPSEEPLLTISPGPNMLGTNRSHFPNNSTIQFALKSKFNQSLAKQDFKVIASLELHL